MVTGDGRGNERDCMDALVDVAYDLMNIMNIEVTAYWDDMCDLTTRLINLHYDHEPVPVEAG